MWMMKPPLMRRTHKAYCAHCHTFLGEIISSDKLREFGRSYISCQACCEQITNKVITIIKKRQQNARQELDGMYELALIVKSKTQFPKRALQTIASFHKDGHLPTRMASRATITEEQ